MIGYIKLNNGCLLPKLGLGTFLSSSEEIKESLPAALKIGYRHIDTAQMYGNEAAIGEVLEKSGLKRSEYYLTSKLMFHHNEEITKQRIARTLSDLKTDYLDLFLIHWPNHENEINLQTWRVFEEYYEKGIFKAIGVSNFTRYQLDYLLKHAKIKPAVNQVEVHPALSQEPMQEYLKANFLNLMAYGPLMRGDLVNEPYFSVLNEIAQNHQATIYQIAIAWGLNRNILMIPKSVHQERLLENFLSQEIKLTEAEMTKINNLNRGKRYYTDPANNVYGIFSNKL